jgi:PQQ-dependent catabolism-associated CXXCW motif protein
MPREDCTEFKGEDAMSLGLVTRVELSHVDLPEGLREKPYLAGTLLSATVPDPEAFYTDMGARQCSTDPCKRVFAEFASYKDHKALAIALNGAGYGMSNGRDSLPQAYLGALYDCNHVVDQPARLCEAQVVDGYDLRPVLAEAVQSHARALAALQVPAQKFYGNEEYGGSPTSAHALRTQHLEDTTPQHLDGIASVGTQELALLLKSAQPPVLVDVWAGNSEALPGAVTLFGGGVAYDDPALEAAYEARFSGLLKLLSPEPGRALIFYCLSPDCWLSANAAMRARRLGYSQVGWYRGGWVSWKAASLPLAKVVVRAVVQ